jgi:uncharacterized phiE125 gp8 family phage protein
MTLKLITEPLEHPITLAEARQHLRVTATAEDALILSLIYAAVEHAETFTRRRFITQTWDLVLDYFPCHEIEIPNAPLQSVSSISYVDTAGSTQVMDAADYQVDVKSKPGRVRPAYGTVWPIPRTQMNAVEIRFVCGYGLAAAVPYPIKAGLLLLIQYFEQRDANEKLLQAAENLLSPYRVVRF